MSNPRRKARSRRAAQAAAQPVRSRGPITSPVLLPEYTQCRPATWVPDLDNAHLQAAAAGRLSIGDPFHRPPAPIDFEPPHVARTHHRRLPVVAR